MNINKHFGRATTRKASPAIAMMAVGAIVLSSCGNSENGETGETINLTVGGGNNPGTMHSFDMVQDVFIPEIQERVAEETDYQLSISEQFGTTVTQGEELDGIDQGLLDIGTSNFTSNPTELAAHNHPWYIPFASTDMEVVIESFREVYESFDVLDEIYEEYNQKPIAFIGVGDYGVASDFSIDSPEDVQGQEIAGIGANLEWLGPMGAVPVQSPASDWYSSLQTGVYNGIVFFSDGFDESLRVYEVLDYYNDLQFGAMPGGALTVNLDSWNDLPEEVQNIIAEVGVEFETEAAQSVNAQMESAKELIENEGMEIIDISDELREAWANEVSELPREQANELNEQGLPGSELMAAYIAAQEELGHQFPVEYDFD